MPPAPPPVLFGRTQGLVNTAFSQIIETFNTNVLHIILESSVTLTPAQTAALPTPVMTVEVSADNGTNWTFADLTNAATWGGNVIAYRGYQNYSPVTPSPPVAIAHSTSTNPGIFPKVRVNVVALGAGVAAIVNWALN